MITNLVVFAYIFFLLFALGVLAKIFTNKLSIIESSPIEDTPIDYYIIFGFLLLTASLGIISIFSKIGLVVHAVIFGITFAGMIIYRTEFFRLFFYYKSYLKKNNALFFYFLALWPFVLLLILYSACTAVVYDTGLYHAQFIQWIQSYKAVPGLAWIHTRFATNSHFHLSCAFFSFSFLDVRNSSGGSIIFYPLNSFFMLMLLSRCIFSVYMGAIRKDSFTIILYGLVFILYFFYFGPMVQSPTPDIATAILIFYVFFVFIEMIGNAGRLWDFSSLLLLSIVFALPTFKLSGALVILILPFLLIHKKFSINMLVLIASMGAFIIVPFFIRNVIISGWLAYPFPQLDLFNFDWKIPIEDVQMEVNEIKAWARIPAVDYNVVLNMGFREWFPLWFKNLFDDSKASFLLLNILLLNLASPLLFSVLYFIDKKKKEFKTYAIVYFVILLNLVFWFITAPDPRFATGYLFFNTAFILALIFKKLGHLVPTGILIGAVFCALLWALEIPKQHWTYFLESSLRREIVIVPKQLEVPSTEFIRNATGNLILTKPVNTDRCFNVKVPCGPYPNVSILLRGNSIEDGFTYPRE